MKKLLILFDYGTSNIWDVTNPSEPKISLEVEGLPVSEIVKNKLIEIRTAYENLFLNNKSEFSFKGFSSIEEKKKFTKLTEQVIKDFKNELPEWIVEIDVESMP